MNSKRLPGGVTDRVIHWSIAFLILLFIGFFFLMSRIWLVTYGSMRVEAELKKQLPDLVPPSLNEEDWPDEVIMSLSEAGEPSINEEPVSDLHKALEQLLKDAGKRKLIVTLEAHPKTSLEKVTQTLEALAKAGIANVTFTVGSEENF
jgi:biopolymer transport protein ExbD